ncbi:MAG: helix-turn-helix domain-containing protein [Candidatus Altiarchaeales archaeon]|nr:helix-turn-helix domain-containing protein [Candidatus Altiarchaeales archaeon]MBD3416583.1 helix-turn-helix domain-containing protein [Candidatus Altiarchaeales archaeon]
MYKSSLVDAVLANLSNSGFEVVDCRGSRSSFDVLAKRKDMLLLVKVLSNVEGLSRPSVSELKRVSELLEAVPIVVSERMKSSLLNDGVVYDRYGVFVSTLNTLKEIIGNIPPRAYSTRGNYCVRVDRENLSDLRKMMGYTQDSFARELGVSKQSVYRYERSGRVSLEIFDKLVDMLGDDIRGADFKLTYEKSKLRDDSQGKITSLKRIVFNEFENMGFNTQLTNAPFDIVARSDQRVFSVVSNDWRRIKDKLSVLDEISDIVGGYSVCISERRLKGEMSVLSPGELAEIDSAEELFKLLSN